MAAARLRSWGYRARQKTSWNKTMFLGCEFYTPKTTTKNPNKKHPEIFLVIFFSGIFHPKSRKHILTYVVTIICDWKNNKLRFSKSDLPMFLKENILETLQEIILVPQCHFQFWFKFKFIYYNKLFWYFQFWHHLYCGELPFKFPPMAKLNSVCA